VTGNVLDGVRRAGVLLHPTSLPGPWDGGVLGGDARRCVDLLADAGFALWQVLPLGPVGDSLSPYQLTSASAVNLRLVDPELLRQAGWLDPADGDEPGDWPYRSELLSRAFAGFLDRGSAADRRAFADYWTRERHWLLPYALFQVARAEFGDQGWWTWPALVRLHAPAAMTALLAQQRLRLQEIAFQQWVFDLQWSSLRLYARDRGLRVVGDLPIYVDLDSVDVWWHRELFRVDAEGQPEVVAGVPPDYFSAEGQLWGNPLYDWPRHAAEGFGWWIRRVKTQLQRADYLRVDHFRGLESCWAVPAGARSAKAGRWEPVPGAELLEALQAACGGQPLVAEDLGLITPPVTALRKRFGLPGMLVLQFAFDGSADNPYLPANHPVGSVVYTGTHDNDTALGWYRSLDAVTRARVDRLLGAAAGPMPGALVQAAFQSPAEIAVVPFQDLLGLGSEARMNVPGTPDGNWRWRYQWSQVPVDFALRWRRELADGGRLAAGEPALRYGA